MAQVCGLKPGEFIHSMGNTHVYLNHIEPLKTQLERTPRPFPVLKINPDVKDIDGFKASDFELLVTTHMAKLQWKWQYDGHMDQDSLASSSGLLEAHHRLLDDGVIEHSCDIWVNQHLLGQTEWPTTWGRCSVFFIICICSLK